MLVAIISTQQLYYITVTKKPKTVTVPASLETFSKLAVTVLAVFSPTSDFATTTVHYTVIWTRSSSDGLGAAATN